MNYETEVPFLFEYYKDKVLISNYHDIRNKKNYFQRKIKMIRTKNKKLKLKIIKKLKIKIIMILIIKKMSKRI